MTAVDDNPDEILVTAFVVVATTEAPTGSLEPVGFGFCVLVRRTGANARAADQPFDRWNGLDEDMVCVILICFNKYALSLGK